jgi:hypothetical protein
MIQQPVSPVRSLTGLQPAKSCGPTVAREGTWPYADATSAIRRAARKYLVIMERKFSIPTMAYFAAMLGWRIKWRGSWRDAAKGFA